MKPYLLILALASLLFWFGKSFFHSPKASVQNESQATLQEEKHLLDADMSNTVLELSQPDTASTSSVLKNTALATPSVVKEILHTLFKAYGNLQRTCPRIEVVQDNLGPRYRESTKTIVLDQLSLKVCRSFKKDSLSALAFIIGHELAHFFQEEPGGKHGEFSYLAYDKNVRSNPEKERLADIQGVFNAYLAGYRTTAILPELISKLYESYQLSSRLEGYPSLKERRQSSFVALATIDTLSELYETANYLSALGQYELAAASYQYILQYYPGREVYNNLGASYALQAMHCSKKSPDAFLYPIELDLESRLRRPRARGGEEDLTEAEQELRTQLLLQAEEYLKMSRRLDPGYFPANLNLFCVLTLQGRFEEALRRKGLIENPYLSPIGKNKARLALGIALSGSTIAADKYQAEKIFQGLATSKTASSLAFIAAHNLKALRGELPEAPIATTAYDCLLPFDPHKVDGVSIHRIKAEKLTWLPGSSGLGFSLIKFPSSTVIQFHQWDRPVFNVQRMAASQTQRSATAPSLSGKHPQIVSTPSGFFLICGEEYVTFLFDDNERLVGWCRYYASR